MFLNFFFLVTHFWVQKYLGDRGEMAKVPGSGLEVSGKIVQKAYKIIHDWVVKVIHW